jgi:cytochrome c-type biogenesis protein CcmH
MTARSSVRTWLLSLALMLSVAGPAFAVQPDEMLRDPALEARARALSEGLRCLVCQNQSIDDSDAPLAKDLRILVRERLKAGDSDQQIIDFIVSRYGEFVLLKPRLSPHTWILWFATPFVLLAALAAIIYGYRRRESTAMAPKPLTASEKRRLKHLVGEG